MTTGPRSPTDAELDEMFENSKNDHWIWVGSDIRILVGEIRRLRASPPPSRAPESDASGAVEWVVNDTAELGVKVGVGAMVSRGGFDAFGWACECGSQSFYVIGRSLERLFIRCNDCHRNWWVRR